jgi:hypothetical protein
MVTANQQRRGQLVITANQQREGHLVIANQQRGGQPNSARLQPETKMAVLTIRLVRESTLFFIHIWDIMQPELLKLQ